MEISNVLLILTFSAIIFKNTIYGLFVWQLKEYRLDRFLVHLNTWQGQKFLFGRTATVKWLLLIFAPFFYFISNRLFLFVLLIIFSFETLLFLKEILFRRSKLPVFTFKIIFISIFVFMLIFVGFTLLPLPFGFKILFFDRGLLLLLGLTIILLNIPARIYHQIIIFKAKEKIRKQLDLFTIGITGSFGKSTTKEFLAQILSKKYQVLETPGNINTDIGVAKTVLKNLNEKHRFFVCEMGAYKKGEIKAICDIVNPKIGIVTGINEQHLALFGNLEKTIATKFELIEALPKKGLAVFNGENRYCLKMAKKAKARGCEVEVVKKEKVDFKTNLPGDIFLINFLLAKKVAESLGVKENEIKKTAQKLKLPSHTMNVLKKNDLVLIDSTHNSNPEGVLRALDFLKNFEGKKFFVFQPIIELGEASGRLHEQIGKKAAKICEMIVLTNRNFYEDFLRGAKGKASLSQELPGIKKGVILFEGREARHYLELIVPNN